MITPDIVTNGSEVRLFHRMSGADVRKSANEDVGKTEGFQTWR
jgi:hypothetical protein